MRRRLIILEAAELGGLARTVCTVADDGIYLRLHEIALLEQIAPDDSGRWCWLVTETGAPLLTFAELARAIGLSPEDLEASFQRLERVGRLTRMGEVFGIRSRAASAPRGGREPSQTPDAIRARARRARLRGTTADYGVTTSPVAAVATAVVDRSTDERPAVDRMTTDERLAVDQRTTDGRPHDDRTATGGPSAEPEAAQAPAAAAPELLRAPARSSSSSSSSDQERGGESGRRSVGRDRRPARPELDALARHLRDLPSPTDADLQLLDRPVLGPLCELYSEVCSARLREVGQEPPEPTNALRRALVARLQEDAGWIHADRWRARVQALADDDWCWREKRPRPGAAVVPATLEWLIANIEKVHAVRAQAPRARPVGHAANCQCASCRSASVPARAVGCG